MSEAKTNGGRLRHSSDSEPGYTRKKQGRYWAYFDADGKRITDREEIDRLNAVGLPPAYENAWFCADPEGHLQAPGVDARGHKQHRYHPKLREMPTQRVDQHCTLPDQLLPRTVQRQTSSMLACLHRDRTYGRPRHGFADYFDVGHVVLLPLHVRLNMRRRH